MVLHAACILPVAVARSSSGGVVILSVLWVMSYLLISQLCSTSPPAEAQCTRSLELDYKLRAVIPVAGQRTTFRALKVTSHMATRGGAESAVCDCVVLKLLRGFPVTKQSCCDSELNQEVSWASTVCRACSLPAVTIGVVKHCVDLI